MAKTVNFIVKLNIDGKNLLVSASADAKSFADNLAKTKTKADELRSSLITFGQIQQSFQSLQNGLQSVSGVLNNLTEESRSFGAAMKAANMMASKDAAGFKELKGQVADLAKSIPMARDQLIIGDDSQ